MRWLGGLLVLVSTVLLAVTVPWVVLRGLNWHSWMGLFGAVALVVVASLLRAARTRILLNFGQKGPLSTQFLDLGAGAMVNAAIPLRLGEVLRAYLLAKQLNISLGFTFVAVFFERLIDLVVVAGFFLILVLVTGASIGSFFIAYAALMLVVATFFTAS